MASPGPLGTAQSVKAPSAIHRGRSANNRDVQSAAVRSVAVGATLRGVGDDERRKVMFGLGFGALVLLWSYFRIGSAYDDLWHYGVDRPSHAALGQGLAVVGFLGSIAALVALTQRHSAARTVALVAAVAGVGTADGDLGSDPGDLGGPGQMGALLQQAEVRSPGIVGQLHRRGPPDGERAPPADRPAQETEGSESGILPSADNVAVLFDPPGLPAWEQSRVLTP